MGLVTRVLRAILAVDTALGTILMPLFVFMIIGCLIAGQFAAALTFAAMGALGAVIYGRYWRRFPLGKFPNP